MKNIFLIKSRQKAPIGTIKVWGGVEYSMTPEGWRQRKKGGVKKDDSKDIKGYSEHPELLTEGEIVIVADYLKSVKEIIKNSLKGSSILLKQSVIDDIVNRKVHHKKGKMYFKYGDNMIPLPDEYNYFRFLQLHKDLTGYKYGIDPNNQDKEDTKIREYREFMVDGFLSKLQTPVNYNYINFMKGEYEKGLTEKDRGNGIDTKLLEKLNMKSHEFISMMGDGQITYASLTDEDDEPVTRFEVWSESGYGKYVIIKDRISSKIDTFAIELFTISPHISNQYKGRQIYLNMEKKIKDQGCKEIVLDAARSEYYTGYNFWPKVGFEAQKPKQVLAAFIDNMDNFIIDKKGDEIDIPDEIIEKIEKVKSIQELFKLEDTIELNGQKVLAGRAIWEEYGHAFSAIKKL